MIRFALASAALAVSAPAMAKVSENSSSGFVIQLGIDVPADPDRTWAELIVPRGWWSADHTFSSDAANLSLEPRAGGCFCEVLPSKVSPNAAPRGSVEHMRVIYAEEPRALRMTGALGPLQAGAGAGTLTIILKPQEEGTRVLWEYAYGGYVRGDVPAMAKAVDGVLAEQLLALGTALGAQAGEESPDEMTEEPAPNQSGSDFLREMQAGIGEAKQSESDSPPRPGLSETPPDKAVNDQGFVGR